MKKYIVTKRMKAIVERDYFAGGEDFEDAIDDARSAASSEFEGHPHRFASRTIYQDEKPEWVARLCLDEESDAIMAKNKAPKMRLLEEPLMLQKKLGAVLHTVADLRNHFYKLEREANDRANSTLLGSDLTQAYRTDSEAFRLRAKFMDAIDAQFKKFVLDELPSEDKDYWYWWE